MMRASPSPVLDRLERLSAREISMGSRLYDLWHEEANPGFPTPSAMFRRMLEAWIEGRDRPPILEAELREASAENERLTEACSRQARLEQDISTFGTLVVIEKGVGRTLSDVELEQLWQGVREDRFVEDGQGGWIVAGTDLHVLEPRVFPPPSAEPEETVAPEALEDLVDQAIAELLRADLQRQVSELDEELLHPEAAQERRRRTVEAALEARMKPFREGIAQIRAQTEAHCRQVEESREKFRETLLREQSAGGKDPTASPTPGDGSRPGLSASARV